MGNSFQHTIIYEKKPNKSRLFFNLLSLRLISSWEMNPNDQLCHFDRFGPWITAPRAKM